MYDMKRAGYEPQVRHTAGRAVEIKFDLTHKIVKEQETVTYSISTQHRDHDRINDDILMEIEE